MRALCALLISCLGCASTVTRLDGEFRTPAGPAKNACESQDWLVVAPTRAEFVTKGGRRSSQRNDGVALYRVGSDTPESIPVLGEDPTLRPKSYEQHTAPVESYDRRQYIAAGLGAAGVIAIGIGTILFVNAFETKMVRRADGSSDEEHSIDGTLAPVGGALILAGFGFGIAGISLNPGQAERSRAEAARYVFLPPEDKRDEVVDMAGRHNQAVRARCERAPAR